MLPSESDPTLTKMEIEDSSALLAEGQSKFQYSVLELRRRPFRTVSVCLGVLCLLLLVGIIGQAVHHNKVEANQQNKHSALLKEQDKLQENLKTVLRDRAELRGSQSRLQDNYNHLSSRMEELETNDKINVESLETSQAELQTSVATLTKERDQLKTSQSELQRRNEDLTKANDFMQKSHNSLSETKDKLQNNYKSVVKERDQLQNSYNNLTRAKEQMQLDYNVLYNEVEELQARHNLSTSEKDKLQSNHDNLTLQNEVLQKGYAILVKGMKQLQAGFSNLVTERDRLSVVNRNLTTERDALEARNSNLTAERDQLQKQLNTTIEKITCLPGWVKFQQSCYYLSSSLSKKTWSNSRSDCKKKGGDLVIITSPEEMAFLNGLITARGEFWIGLSDSGQEANFVWVDGTPLVTPFWAEGQPNHHGGKEQDCVEFWHRSSGNGAWNDEQCTLESSWICEI